MEEYKDELQIAIEHRVRKWLEIGNNPPEFQDIPEANLIKEITSITKGTILTVLDTFIAASAYRFVSMIRFANTERNSKRT